MTKADVKPNMPGVKNTHKSLFMWRKFIHNDLPRIQVMNVHSAFLFGRKCVLI